MPDRARSAQRHDSESRLLFGWTQPQARAEFGFTSQPQPRAGQGSPRLIADDSEAHVLVIAPTGAGKGRNFIIPNLLNSTAPMIVLDVKGEAARVTARWRREKMGHEVVILDPFHVATDQSASLNPLDRLAGDGETVADEAFTLATLLSEGHRFERDAFWDDLGEALLSGLFVHIAKSQFLKSRALGDVWEIIAADDFVYALAVLLDKKCIHPFAAQQFGTFMQHEGEKVRSSVRSVAQQHMRIFASKAVQQSVASTSFDLGAVKSGAPMTIYLVIPPTKIRSHSALLKLWLATLLGVITDRVTAPPQPTIFMVDELAQLGNLPIIAEAVTLLRGYGLRCCLFLQSLAQLRSLYPRDHEIITENCGALVTFGHTTMSMSRQIAEVLGDVSPDALFSMTGDQIAVHLARRPTVIGRRIDYLHDELFRSRYDANPRYRSAGDAPAAEQLIQRYADAHGRKGRGRP